MENTKKLKVAINGFGRIGRAFLKIAWERNDIEIIAVNDLGSIESLSYLLRHDTVYGNWGHKVEVIGTDLVVDGKAIKFISEKDTTKLPWKDLNIDVVVEATPGATILLGINEDKFGSCDITSNASCTTNAASPLIAILHEAIGIEKAILNTVHGYTATQSLVDGPSKKDLREGRAAAQNIIPSSTGAAIAVTEAFPELKGLFDGISIRVPVICGSIVDITFIAKRDTTKEEVNEILKKASSESRWEKLFAVTEDHLVSSDIIGDSHASIADLEMTRVVGGNLVKVMGWYDNEMGYTYTLLDHVIKTGNTIK